ASRFSTNCRWNLRWKPRSCWKSLSKAPLASVVSFSRREKVPEGRMRVRFAGRSQPCRALTPTPPPAGEGLKAKERNAENRKPPRPRRRQGNPQGPFAGSEIWRGARHHGSQRRG